MNILLIILLLWAIIATFFALGRQYLLIRPLSGRTYKMTVGQDGNYKMVPAKGETSLTKVMILTYWIHPRNLTEEELANLSVMFPGNKIFIKEIKPLNAKGHYKLCQKLGAYFVLVPDGRSILQEAQNGGFMHVMFNKEAGEWMKLLPIRPQLEVLE